jgi:nucleoside phosphorylase/CheY-like chemotaxis protein
MHILIVDDSIPKRTAIAEVIASSSMPCEIDTAKSVASAASAMINKHYNLLILDLCLPSRDGEPPDRNGGPALLSQLERRRDFQVPDHVIGLTEYAEVAAEHANLFEMLTWSLLQYDSYSNKWCDPLIRKIEHILATESISVDNGYIVDFALVTALESPELTAVREVFPELSRISVTGDDSFFYRGDVQTLSGTVSVVAASAIEMGMPAATAISVKTCIQFKPRVLGMVGICAGLNCNYGDIIVADRAWDYGSGKLITPPIGEESVPRLFEPAPTAIPLDSSIDERMKSLVVDPDTIRRIANGWSGSRPEGQLRAFKGPMASGAAVLANSEAVESIKKSNRKVRAIEMEAYGVFLAARVCPAPRPKCFVVKSASDFGDGTKDDRWQSYAAYTSASFAREYMCQYG